MTPNPLPVLLALASSAALLAQHPIVPGVERLRAHASSTPVERGSVLLGELSCTACHAPGAGAAHLTSRRAPDLQRIHSRVTTSWLSRFLRDPHGSKPGTLMPRWEPAADAATRDEHADLLLHYLASRSEGLPASKGVFDAKRVAAGRELYHSVGCVACHAPEDGRATDVASVPLGQLAHKTTIESLKAFLLDPQKVRPASRMPNLWLSDGDADAIARYLLREQADNPQAKTVAPPEHKGLHYEFVEIDKREMPDFETATPAQRGFVSSVTNRVEAPPRKDKYALRLRGSIRVPADGAYTFYLRSHGSARLRVDGEVVVVDGVKERSGLAELTKGEHAFEVEYFHFKGKRELSAHWLVPGGRKRPIPANVFTNRFGQAMVPLESPTEAFVVDRAKAAKGASLFRKLRCNACHEPETDVEMAQPLAALDPTRAGSCIDAKPQGRAVAYALSAAQTADVRTALTGQAYADKPTSQAQARRELAAFNCYACHARGEIGGPDAERDEFFETKISIDLGDEGRLPPALDGVGSKLRRDVLGKIIHDGEHHIRGHFMATRMPGFAASAAARLVESLANADPDRAERKPEFSVAAVEAGRKIVGISGFACVTCHNVNGGESAAIPGIDLASVTARLQPAWFHEYMRSPPKLRPGTRMPAFWAGDASPLQDLLGGSTDKQIDAIWSYLSLGKSIPVPSGLKQVDGAPKMELIPRDEPIVHRTFMDKVSQRTILVGYPENVHVAFDAQAVRLAKVWRGRFFDASGVASGRTMRAFGPLGDEALDLPHTAFARLTNATSAWPSIAANARDVGGEFRGYFYDEKRRPVFRYSLADVTIREQPIPVYRPGGGALQRRFELDAKAPPGDLHFLAWRGTAIQKIAANTWKSGDVTIKLRLDPRHKIRIRPAGEMQELLVQIQFQNGPVRFEEEIQW